ncbi:LPXTG cell wall anchor domain-containing protein, partial [Streptococcus suis]
TSTSNANKSTKKAKQLPNTGEKATSLGLAVLGMGLALFAAKRKKDEEEA